MFRKGQSTSGGTVHRTQNRSYDARSADMAGEQQYQCKPAISRLTKTLATTEVHSKAEPFRPRTVSEMELDPSSRLDSSACGLQSLGSYLGLCGASIGGGIKKCRTGRRILRKTFRRTWLGWSLAHVVDGRWEAVGAKNTCRPFTTHQDAGDHRGALQGRTVSSTYGIRDGT